MTPLWSTTTGRATIRRRLESVGPWSLVERVAREHQVSPAAILSLAKNKSATEARHQLWHLIRSGTKMSLPEIGALMDVDHVSIMYGDRKHAERIAALYRTEAAE